MLDLYNNTETGVVNVNVCSDQQQYRSALALTTQAIEIIQKVNCKDNFSFKKLELPKDVSDVPFVL